MIPPVGRSRCKEFAGDARIDFPPPAPGQALPLQAAANYNETQMRGKRPDLAGAGTEEIRMAARRRARKDWPRPIDVDTMAAKFISLTLRRHCPVSHNYGM
jgi:hypothetical protein